MRILFWTDGYWPRVGGIETQAVEFVRGMSKRGHEVQVVAQTHDLRLAELESCEGVSIRRFDFSGTMVNRHLSHLRVMEGYFESLMKGFKPDLIQLNACAGWGAFIFLMFKRLWKVPIILTVHNPVVYETDQNPLLEKICKAADQICCVSKWALDWMEKLLPETKAKLSLVYNGLSEPDLRPTPLSFAPPTFLLLGRLAIEKGFDTAILAFALLKQRGIKGRLLIAGEGPERSSLEKLIESEGLNDSVLFLGEIAKEKVPALLNQATIVLVPSYFESFGLVALEAMQMERPVIASRVGGLEEVVAPLETGLLISPRDPKALYEAILELLKEPVRAVQMGKEGRKRALKFSLEKNLDGYESAYNMLTVNSL